MIAKSLVIIALSAWLAGNCLGAAQVSPGIAQVVKLHESNVGPEVLLAYVKETPIAKPNADEVLYLTEKGIPKEVIVTLLSKRVWAETPPPQSQSQPAAQAQSQLPPAVTAAQPATQTVVHVQQPAPAVTYAAPYYPYYYPYYRPYYNPWPAFSIGLGFGYGWGHGWHGHRGHHHHGIRVHHR